MNYHDHFNNLFALERMNYQDPFAFLVGEAIQFNPMKNKTKGEEEQTACRNETPTNTQTTFGELIEKARMREEIPVAKAKKRLTKEHKKEDDNDKDKRKKNIPKHVKTLVWNKYIGADKAKTLCMCCRQAEINIRSFHCGHVVAEAKGGDMTINNLRPICADCNHAMGTMSMNDFTLTFFGWVLTNSE